MEVGSRQKIIEDVIESVKNAAIAVDGKYFKLTTTYELSGIVRERVFCYEFYHQLRLYLGDDHKLTLNAEIDKRGHVDFAAGDRKNPDFVFHIPGTHTGNTVIVEVKGTVDGDIPKDFETLATFISKYNYLVGIFLIYNHTIDELVRIFRSQLLQLKNSGFGKVIYIISIPSSGNIEAAKCVEEIELGS